MRIDWHRIFTPSAWMQKTPTDWLWDDELNSLLDSGQPAIFVWSRRSCMLGKHRIWLSNWPFAYGMHLMNETYEDISGVPSLKTRKRLRAYIRRAKI